MSGFCIGTRALEEPPAAEDYLRRNKREAGHGPQQWHRIEDSTEEEVVFVDGSSVIWTRGRILKRAFDFEADGQEVSHALFAQFPSADSDIQPATSMSEDGPRQPRFAASRNAFKSTAHLRHLPSQSKRAEIAERALVLLLKEIAYVYYDDGRRDVIHLPFRVKKAFACKTGVLLQRWLEPSLASDQHLPALFFLPHPLDEVGVITASDDEWTAADNVMYTGHGLLVSYNRETSKLKLWSLDFLAERASETSLHSNRQSQARRRSSMLRPGASMGPDDFHSTRTDASLHAERVVFSDMDPTLLFSEADSLRKDATLRRIETYSVASARKCTKVIVLQERSSLIVMAHMEPQQVISTTLKRSSKGRLSIAHTERLMATAVLKLQNYALLLQPDGSLVLRTPLGLKASVEVPRLTRLFCSRGPNLWTTLQKSFTLNLTLDPLVGKVMSGLQIVLSRQHHEQLFFAILHASRQVSGFDAFTAAIYAGFMSGAPPSLFDASMSEKTEVFHECNLDFFKSYYPQLVLAIHFMHEELALDVLTSHWSQQLVPILLQLSSWLGWQAFVEFYQERLANPCAVDEARLPHVQLPPPAETLPSLLQWIEQRARGVRLPMQTIHLLSIKRDSSAPSKQATVCQLTQSLLTIYDCLFSSSKSLHHAVELMTQHLTLEQLDRLPQVFAIPLRDAMARCSMAPSVSWTAKTLRFVGRHDLADFLDQADTLPNKSAHMQLTDVKTTAEASRSEAESNISNERSLHQDTLRMLWPVDLRLRELERMLCYSQPAVVSMPENESLGEAELVHLQQSMAHHIAKRTLAVPVGSGLFEYDSTDPMPTELFTHHPLNLDVKFRPANFTVAEDKEVTTPTFKMWGQFHSGCAAGLSISPRAHGVSASWIVYNRPVELDDKHAGFLLGLGLNGHLKVMATWHAFNYLTSKHTMTSIGLLLGMSASFLGTMDSMITKLLSVHVLALLPQGANELNLSGQTQSAGLMGIGLLYFDSMHRRMTEVMLGEICATDSSEEHFREESYRLSAAFSLGLINVGHGLALNSLSDVQMYKKLVSCVHGLAREKHNLDVKIPASIMALALVFLQTDSQDIAGKLAAPETIHDLECVRPDILMLRVLASSLILWSRIEATDAFVCSKLPTRLHPFAKLSCQVELKSDDMPLYNMVAGACLAIGLRYAGTRHTDAIGLLLRYLDQFLRLAQISVPGPDQHDQKLCKVAVRNCLGVLCLSNALVAAGTGDLQVMRRLRVVHGQTDPEIRFGAYLAVDMALGFLFMGGGRYTLASTKRATAFLLIACYPILPNAVGDNGTHLQAFRHLWVLAAEPRCILPRDTVTRALCAVPLTLQMADTSSRTVQAPCLLPPLETVQKISLATTAFSPLTLDFGNGAAGTTSAHLAAFQRDQTLWVSRRMQNETLVESVVDAALQDDEMDSLLGAMLAVLPASRRALKPMLAGVLRSDPIEDKAAASVARMVLSRDAAVDIQGSDMIETYMHVTTRGRLKEKFSGATERLLTEEDLGALQLQLWQARK